MLNIEFELSEHRQAVLRAQSKSIDRVADALFSRAMPMTSWLSLPVTMSPRRLAAICEVAEGIRAHSTALVVVGIGGSYAGTCACDEMLGPCGGVRLYYAGWNLSAQYHRGLLEKLDGEEVSICVVSKSGKTLETALTFNLLREYLQKRYGEAFSERVVVITGTNDNPLRREALQHGYTLLDLDEDVGGRYSVLSPVGLLPLAAAGCDIRALIEGAGDMRRELLSAPFSQTACGRYAALHGVLYDEGKRIEVFSFTETHMQAFGQWLTQLFGESNGKDGMGIFPTIVHYSTDLHSLGQFLEQGSPIFFETMLTVRNRRCDLAIPGGDSTYNSVLNAVSDAVWEVRNARNTPIFRITVEDLSARSIGELLYFFEVACAVSSLHMGVNPFDQPGVEAYKNELRKLIPNEMQ